MRLTQGACSGQFSRCVTQQVVAAGSQWSTKESNAIFGHLLIVFGTWNNCLKLPQMEPGFFPANTNVADVLDDMDLDFEKFKF